MSTIVVIDDNTELREIVAIVLREEGHVVETAADGLTGLDVVVKLVPDLIISDVSMPGLDGMALRSRLNDHSELAAIPFLFISAHQHPETVRQGMMLGAGGYLTKPFRINELLRAVERRLKQRDQAISGEDA